MTTGRRNIIKLFLAGLGGLVVNSKVQKSAAGSADKNRLTGQESRTFSVTGVPRVRVETFDGVITIRAWDRPEVKFVAAKEARDEEEMRGVSVSAEQRGEEVVINAEFDKAFKREVVFNGSRFLNFTASVALEVYVPRRAALYASTGDGDLFVEEFAGEADLRTSDGAVEVGRGEGSLRAFTKDGEIRVSNFAGEADLRSDDGPLKLGGRFQKLSAHTAKGDISLSLPAGFNAFIETNTPHVHNIDGLALTAESVGEQAETRRWKLGSGGESLLTLGTGRGQVSLRRVR
jgi:hypothetical protein